MLYNFKPNLHIIKNVIFTLLKWNQSQNPSVGLDFGNQCHDFKSIQFILKINFLSKFFKKFLTEKMLTLLYPTETLL
jgi:hypothetical protein